MPKFLLSLFSVFALSLVVVAQTKQTVMNGKSYYVFPFNASAPEASELTSGVGFQENWSGETRVVEPLQTKAHVLPLSLEGSVFEKAAREVPWFWYFSWYGSPAVPPPALDSLPDGDYVRYYQGLPYVDVDTVKFRFGVIQSVFSMKNNLPDGPVVVLEANGDTIQTGSFSKGFVDGEWYFYRYGYSAFPEEGDYKEQEKWLLGMKSKTNRMLTYETVTYYQSNKMEGVRIEKRFDYPGQIVPETESRSTYHKDIEEGLHELYLRGSLMEKGTKSRGMETGEWWYYVQKDTADHSDKPEMLLRRHFIIPEERKEGKGVIIRNAFYESTNDTIYPGGSSWLKDLSLEKNPIVNGDYISFEYFYDILPSDSARKANPYTKYIAPSAFGVNPNRMYYLPGNKLGRAEAAGKLGYAFKYSLYEEYYPNGQLMLRLKVNDGQLEKEDTIFWSNGRPCNVVNFLPESNRYEEKMFNQDGLLVKHDFFDATGRFIETRVNKTGVLPKQITLDGLELNWDQSGYYSYRFQWITDTIKGFTVFLEIRRPDSSLVERSTYDPAKRTLIHDVWSGTFTQHIEGTISADSLTFSGRGVTKMGDFSRVIGLNYELSKLGNRFSNRVFSLSTMPLSSFGRAGELLYKGQPYSGKVSLSMKTQETGYKKTKNGVAFTLDRKDLYAVRCFSEMTFYAFNSISSETSVGKTEPDYIPSTDKGQYLNGIPQGEWKSFFGNGKLCQKSSFDGGMRKGPSVTYNYMLPKSSYAENDHIRRVQDTFPSKPVYYLMRSSQGNEDSKGYEWTGRLIESYDNKTGESFRAYHNGETYSTYRADSNIYVHKSKEPNGKYTSRRMASLANPVVDSSDQNLLAKLKGRASFYERCSAVVAYDTSNSVVLRYKKDILGEYTFYEEYFPNGDLKKRVNFADGFIISFEQWSNGTLKRNYTFSKTDLVTFAELDQLLEGENGQIYSYQNFTALMKSIDPDGTLRQEGKIGNDGKSGPWNYYDAKGRLYRTVHYNTQYMIIDSGKLTVLTDSLLLQNLFDRRYVRNLDSTEIDSIMKMGRLTFSSPGTYQLFDTLGNQLAEGYLLEWFEKHNCSNDDYYETFIYTIGSSSDSLMRNGWNSIRDENGIVKAEGMMKDGFPEGFWKFYNADRTIREAGIYYKAQRHGRWLSGDLSKVNYLGDLCLGKTSEAELKEMQQNLDLTVTNYVRGVEISSSYFQVDLGK